MIRAQESTHAPPAAVDLVLPEEEPADGLPYLATLLRRLLAHAQQQPPGGQKEAALARWRSAKLSFLVDELCLPEVLTGSPAAPEVSSHRRY